MGGLEVLEPLGRTLAEVRRDQRLVDAGALGHRAQLETVAGGVHRLLEGEQGGIRPRALEGGHAGLTLSKPAGQLSLGEAGGEAGAADDGCARAHNK